MVPIPTETNLILIFLCTLEVFLVDFSFSLSYFACIGLDIFIDIYNFNILEDESEDVTDNHAEHEARDNEENVKNNKSERIGTNKSWSSFCI